jgi:hypothetical protein
MRVRIVSNGTPTAWMEGACTSYVNTSPTLSFTCDYFNGTGAYADWNVGLAGTPGQTGPAGIQGIQGISGDLHAPFGGRLMYVSPTQLSYLPYKGDCIKINGIIYQIPTTGVVGLTNTNCFVNGVAGQSLAANFGYWVYVFNNGGTLTADFSTTSYVISTTTGNVGIACKSGDPTRSLIGLVSQDNNGRFWWTPQYRLVRSWFNRPRVSFTTNLVNFGPAGGSGGYFYATGHVVWFNMFADDVVNATYSGILQNQDGIYNCYIGMGFDGSGGPACYTGITTSNTGYYPVSTSNSWGGMGSGLAEGNHYVQGWYQTGGGSLYGWGLTLAGTIS